jgi:hypothetical protein
MLLLPFRLWLFKGKGLEVWMAAAAVVGVAAAAAVVALLMAVQYQG